MRFKVFLIALVLGLLSVPVFAQEGGSHTATIDGFSFSYDAALAHNVNILHFPGDPVEGAGAGFSDAANTLINLYDVGPAPESPIDANTKAGIRIYAVSDLAKYDFMQAQVDQLQALIDGKTDLSAFETQAGGDTALPYLPVPIHGQILRTHTTLIETDSLKGIGYLTVTPTMDSIEPFTHSSFIYVFQGISADGKTYISAFFPLDTKLFPQTMTDDWSGVNEHLDEVLSYSAKTLDEGQASDFTPSLDTIDSLIQSFAFKQS